MGFGGAKQQVPSPWGEKQFKPCRLGGPQRFKAGGQKSKVAHKWVDWLHNPCR